MKYMYLIRTTDLSGPPPPRLMAEINKLADKPGVVMLDGGQLTGDGACIRLSKGRIAVTDGPFAETKEVIAGYAVFEFATREEAVQSGVDFIEVHRLYGDGWEGLCEMRPMLD